MQKQHSWFFYLCAIEGAAAIAALFLIPSEGGRLSPARLALIGFILILCIVWMVIGLRRPRFLDKPIHPAFIMLSAVLSLTFGLFLFLLRYLNPEGFLSTYQRLSPLLWYLLILSVQSFFFLLLLYKGFHPENLSKRSPIYLPALTVFCFLLLMVMLVSLTRLGLTPDPAYWGEPGVPLLGWQFALALVGGFCVLCLTFSARARILDTLLPIGIYLLAIALWLGVPTDVLSNSFYMPINPPTFQPFPYSDAGYYDQMAQTLLIGHPYQGEIPTRPMYIFLLTVLHLLFGENYRNIIMGQTFVLALIPVIFYHLGRKLHSRVAGVTIALFFIFREMTTMMVSSDTRVSNTKSLLVDLPTLLLLILACLFTLRWLEQWDEKSALVAGGLFGLLLLLRTQSMLVLPLIILAALLVFGWKNRSIYLLISVFFLGLLVTILPWLTHNYLQTGQLAFDAPFQYKVIASQYAYSGNLDIENYDFEGKGLGRVLIEFAVKDPAFVFGFIANHFLAAQIHGMLALPLMKPYNGIFEPINLYWMEWNGSLEWYNVLLLLFYLAVIALGFASAWKRWRWIGLLPVAFSAGYALATAVGRFSGWRYDLPADWIWYFYFGIGVAELLLQAAQMFGLREEKILIRAAKSPPREASGAKSKRPQLIFFAFIFAFIGALPWMIKNIAAPRYADQSRTILEAEFGSLPNAPSIDEMNEFISQPKAFVQIGRVIYPRFFSRNDGLASTNPWPAYAIYDYPRIGFVLLNQNSTWVVFPTKRLSDFPHAQDAIVLGCQREGYVEARWIALPELDTIYSSEALTESCSP
ncbi:MAG TPA: glycosyltransferase family 39 protein [Anaerolineales bacterium]|nr:glycosyltransferase family 39 protein [Anaerolineales bacterium]